MRPISEDHMCSSTIYDHHKVPKVPCLGEMWRLHTMLWQQQPSQQVLQHGLRCAPTSAVMPPAMQDALVHSLTSELMQVAPPNISYIARVVKQAVTAAEEDHQELSEALLRLHTTLLVNTGKEEDSKWRYKTFYYSDRPSWCQLQQLQLQQCRDIQHSMMCVDSTCPRCALSAGGDHVQPSRQQCQARWVIPAHIRHQLQQRQLLMQQLLLPTQHMQQFANTVDCMTQETSSSSNSIQSPSSYSPDCHDAATRCTSGQNNDHCPPSSNDSDTTDRCLAKGLITICSSDNLFEGSTGCHMWDAGFLLAEFVLNHQHIFAGRSVMELGCGPGLVAACICRSGADKLLLTDGDPQTLINCLSNLSLNGHSNATLLGSWQDAQGFIQPMPPVTQSQVNKQPQVLACALDWHEDVPGLTAEVIVGSDICYDPDAVPSLVRLLQQVLIPSASLRGTPSETQHTAGITEGSGSLAQSDDAANRQCDAAGGAADGGCCCAGQANPTCLRTSLGCAARCNATDAVIAVGAAEGSAAQGTTEAPVAFIATTRRQDTTLQLFLDKCAEAQLLVEEISKDPEAWLQHQSCSSARMLHSTVAKANGSAARFQELPPLQAAAGREQYVLHKVTSLL